MNPSQEPAPQHDEQAAPYEPPPAYPYGDPAGVVGWEPQRPHRRPLRRTILVTLSVIGALAAAGAPLGLLWSWLSPAVPVINAGQNGIVVNDPSPEEYIAADGWFTLIGFGFGLLAAVVVWLVLRRDRGPGLLLGVTLGGLASALVMWQVGRLVGLSAWNDWQDVSRPGQTYGRPPDLQSHGALLVIAFAAVIVTTLMAGWSNDPDLDQPGARPGYGNDLGGAGSGSSGAGPDSYGPGPDYGPGSGGPDSYGPGPGPGGPGPYGPGASGPYGPGPVSPGPQGPGQDGR